MGKIQQEEELINILLQKYKNAEETGIYNNITTDSELSDNNGGNSNKNNYNGDPDHCTVFCCNNENGGCDPLDIEDFQEMWNN